MDGASEGLADRSAERLTEGVPVGAVPIGGEDADGRPEPTLDRASEGLEEPVGTLEGIEVGSMLGDALRILLGVELGPEDSLEEPVGTLEGIDVGSMLGDALGVLLEVLKRESGPCPESHLGTDWGKDEGNEE